MTTSRKLNIKKYLLIFVMTIAAISYIFRFAINRAPAKAVGKIDNSFFHSGDIIFQSSKSEQAIAIRMATDSYYSHCGIIYNDSNQLYVYEAVQPVRLTPFNEWIARGEGGRFQVRRLKDADKILTPATILKMKAEGEKYLGKDDDNYFGWSDEQIYCSELVWKIYKQATGLSIGELQPLVSLNLSVPLVQEKLYERYGKNIPLNEKVITPLEIYKSPLLITVYANGKPQL
ncbi:YiiX family permuted papain-like enzyme [soil metagenome]